MNSIRTPLPSLMTISRSLAREVASTLESTVSTTLFSIVSMPHAVPGKLAWFCSSETSWASFRPLR